MKTFAILRESLLEAAESGNHKKWHETGAAALADTLGSSKPHTLKKDVVIKDPVSAHRHHFSSGEPMLKYHDRGTGESLTGVKLKKGTKVVYDPEEGHSYSHSKHHGSIRIDSETTNSLKDHLLNRSDRDQNQKDWG